eukprot:24682_1
MPKKESDLSVRTISLASRETPKLNAHVVNNPPNHVQDPKKTKPLLKYSVIGFWIITGILLIILIVLVAKLASNLFGAENEEGAYTGTREELVFNISDTTVPSKVTLHLTYSDALLISWNRVIDESEGDSYRIEYKPSGVEDFTDIRVNNGSDEFTSHKMWITNLEPDTNYSVRYTAHLNGAWLDYSPLTRALTRKTAGCVDLQTREALKGTKGIGAFSKAISSAAVSCTTWAVVGSDFKTCAREDLGEKYPKVASECISCFATDMKCSTAFCGIKHCLPTDSLKCKNCMEKESRETTCKTPFYACSGLLHGEAPPHTYYVTHGGHAD